MNKSFDEEIEFSPLKRANCQWQSGESLGPFYSNYDIDRSTGFALLHYGALIALSRLSVIFVLSP